MKKIPTIFKRNPENMRELLRDPHPDCAWVFNGEGVATRKYDGTCVLIEYDGSYWKRREVKQGKTAPHGFISVGTDSVTGKTIGWMPVDPIAKEDRYHMEAFDPAYAPGTHELVGPKIQGNPEGYNEHILLRHDSATKFYNIPLDFEGIAAWLQTQNIEGLVFHHPDGRMAKIKKRDFGLKRA